MKRFQKNVTLSIEQEIFLKENFGKLNLGEIAKSIGVTYNKLHNNARLLGLVKSRVPVNVNENGVFNEELFFKHYNF
jgi:hypothetical protein